MRKTLAVALIALVAYAPWWALKPVPETHPADQPAQLLSVMDLQHDGDWFGGFSGLEVTPDGQRFYAATDRGYLMRGSLARQAGRLTDIVVSEAQPLVDQAGRVRQFPHTDAEGLAFDDEGRLFVSFEHANRILRYDTWDAPAIWPSYTRAWRALKSNGGLEMVAVDAQGTLFTIPEGVAQGAWEALVYRRFPEQKWEQAFTLPLSENFVPVGGDFGPNGRLYLLERKLYPFAFMSRVRSMTVAPDGFEDIRTELETTLGRHGNLEGLAVWQDDAGRIRLTMVSDDNFLWLLPSQIVEYVLTD